MVQKYLDSVEQSRKELANSCIEGLRQLVTEKYTGELYLGVHINQNGAPRFYYKGGKLLGEAIVPLRPSPHAPAAYMGYEAVELSSVKDIPFETFSPEELLGTAFNVERILKEIEDSKKPSSK